MLFLQIILPVFIIVFAGYLLEKRASLDARTLSYSSLYLFSPALVFASLMKREVPFRLAGDVALFALLYTGAMLLLSITVSMLLRYDREERSALHLTTVVMNVGNFGLPLSLFAFGEAGLEVSILTFFFFNLMLSSLAIVMAQGEKTSPARALFNAMKIPMLPAGILALLLQGMGITIHEAILRPLDLLGQAAIPLMLVLLGMQLARMKLTTRLPFLGVSATLRLVVSPLLAVALTSLLGIGGLDRKVMVLQTSTPSAILPLLYALKFGTRPDLVAGGIFVSTFLSAGTLTLLLYLMR